MTDQGQVRIDTPRDRKSRFEPQLVRKGQRRLAGLDEKIIALYGGGMTTREIETYISDLYGPGVSRETVSRVTAAVLEDAKAWQTRPLEQIYPIVYLDALVIKIRDGHAVRNFACYLAIGVNLDGDRDVLGMWFQKTEGAKFWLGVLTDLKTRGVQDVLVCCVDGLKGFPEAIEAVFPNAWVQTCIVHAIRAALRFVPYKDKKKVAVDLRKIYTAADRDHAERELERFAETWDPQIPDDLRLVDRELGADRPVPRLSARRPPGGLHDEHDRGAQPPDPQNHQDPRQLPRRGLSPQAGRSTASRNLAAAGRPQRPDAAGRDRIAVTPRATAQRRPLELRRDTIPAQALNVTCEPLIGADGSPEARRRRQSPGTLAR